MQPLFTQGVRLSSPHKAVAMTLLSHLHSVFATDAPIISVPQNYTVVEGADVHITFEILAHPPPHTLQYSFNGVRLNLSQTSGGSRASSDHVMLVADRKGTLLIKNVRRSDEGVYSLRAVNDYGEDISQTHLFVLCKCT